MFSRVVQSFLLALVLVFAGNLPAFSQTEKPGGAITAMPGAGDDQAIEQRIRGIFNELDGLAGISVSVKSGVVDLNGTVTEAILATKAEELAGRVDGVVAVQNNLTEETALEERLIPVYERLQSRLSQGVNYLPLAMVALLVWMLASATGLVIARLEWPWNRLTPNAFIADLVRQLIRILFFAIGIVLALDVLGATAVIGTLLGAAGIVGLAVGFAVRDTVENYIASIMLSIRQPFNPKDFVRIEGYEGFVISLTSRATILMEKDGNHIRIPNAIVFKSTLVNYSTNPRRRFVFELGVDAESNLDKALDVGLKTLQRQGFILQEPSPDAWIEALGDSNVVLSFVGWIDQTRTDFQKARSEAMRLVKLALESSGFSLPEPIYRLRFDDAPALENLLADRKQADREHRNIASKEAVIPETVEEVPNDTEADRDLEKQVDQERRAAQSEDLLDEDAPKEFGAKAVARS
ncbi:mechanosensitive ion channel domain-containing protein [Roseibium sp. LAB1]